MRVFWTLSGGLAAFLSVLLISGCGGGGSSEPPNPVQVSVTLSGSGTVTSSPAGINCGTTCSQTFSAGTQVTLSATPATGFSFGGWSGSCTGTGPCVLPTSGAQSVTASFTGSGPLQVTVTLAGSGKGTVSSAPAGIDCGATCTHTFAEGTQVTLTATPTAGFSFTGWSGACTGTNTCALAHPAPSLWLPILPRPCNRSITSYSWHRRIADSITTSVTSTITALRTVCRKTWMERQPTHPIRAPMVRP